MNRIKQKLLVLASSFPIRSHSPSVSIMAPKTYTYRWLGWGILPNDVQQKAVMSDVGCPGRFVLKNYKAPGKSIGTAYKRFSVGMAITDEQLVLYRGRPSLPRPLMRLPWNNNIWKDFKVSTEGDALLLEWNIETFQDLCQGEMQVRVRTDQAADFLTEINNRIVLVNDETQKYKPENFIDWRSMMQ
jgi:hypothetical protein